MAKQRSYTFVSNHTHQPQATHCINCGAAITTEGKFCPFCGSKLPSDTYTSTETHIIHEIDESEIKKTELRKEELRSEKASNIWSSMAKIVRYVLTFAFAIFVAFFVFGFIWSLIS